MLPVSFFPLLCFSATLKDFARDWAHCLIAGARSALALAQAPLTPR
jgi:hypothetical protein